MEAIQDVMKKLPMNTGSVCNYEPGMSERMKAETANSENGKLNQKDGYDCQICRNKGYIIRAVEENGFWRIVSQECQCMKTRRTIRRIKESGLGNLIIKCTFDKFEALEDWKKTMKNAAASYAKSPQGWFFIGGQSGCGKTHICTAICRELILQGLDVVYMLWRDDVTRLKAMVTDVDKYDNNIQIFKRAEVLYLDDLFKVGNGMGNKNKQKPTMADINIAFELLNYRSINNLQTIISSEFTIAELLEIDQALAGRIVENANPMPIVIRPDIKKNYRLKKVGEI